MTRKNLYRLIFSLMFFLLNNQAEASSLRPVLMQNEGFNASEKIKLQQAMLALEQVVNSAEFKQRVLRFINKQGLNEFASNQGLSNFQIYHQFMEGRETLQPHTPGEMNFYLKLYMNRFSKVIGWTNGDINTIHINNKFFRNFGPHEVAGNLAHEWAHKLGFGHNSAAEHDSVPYAIGYMVREMAAKILKIKPTGKFTGGTLQVTCSEH